LPDLGTGVERAEVITYRTEGATAMTDAAIYARKSTTPEG
jgi:hypothetical protein